jgi:ATP-dependent DNA ligase
MDGEIVCLDSEGRSLLNQLLYRRAEPAFYCFDLLWLNGRDLRQLQLIERKKQLHKLIAKSRCERVTFAQHTAKHGITLYREICERDLEGIVAKRRDSVYSSAGQWLKILNPNYTQRNGRHEKFTAFEEHSRRATV